MDVVDYSCCVFNCLDANMTSDLTTEALRDAIGAALNAIHLQLQDGMSAADRLDCLAESCGRHGEEQMQLTLQWFADCLRDHQ